MKFFTFSTFDSTVLLKLDLGKDLNKKSVAKNVLDVPSLLCSEEAFSVLTPCLDNEFLIHNETMSLFSLMPPFLDLLLFLESVIEIKGLAKLILVAVYRSKSRFAL